MEQALINIIKNSMEAIETDGNIVIALHPELHKLNVLNVQGGSTLVKEILLNHEFAFSLKTIEVARTVFEILFKETFN